MAERKPPCPFGAACYRKNPLHFIEFSHPPDASASPSSVAAAATLAPGPGEDSSSAIAGLTSNADAMGITPRQVLAFLTTVHISGLPPAELTELKAAAAVFCERAANYVQAANFRAAAPPALLARVHPESGWSCRRVSWSCRGCGSDHHHMLVADLSLSRYSDGVAVACKVVGRSGCTDIVTGPWATLDGEQFLSGWLSTAIGKHDFDYARSAAVDRALNLDLAAMNIAVVRRQLGVTAAVDDDSLRTLFLMIIDLMEKLVTKESQVMEDEFNIDSFIKGNDSSQNKKAKTSAAASAKRR